MRQGRGAEHEADADGAWTAAPGSVQYVTPRRAAVRRHHAAPRSHLVLDAELIFYLLDVLILLHETCAGGGGTVSGGGGDERGGGIAAAAAAARVPLVSMPSSSQIFRSSLTRSFLRSVFFTSIFFSYLSSHICASFFFSLVHSRFALMPRVRLLLISRLTPPAEPCSLSPMPM